MLKSPTGKTWIQREEYAYTPRGSMQRKGRAIFADGKIRAIRAGIADTYFSIPACARIAKKYATGYVYIGDDREIYFHKMEKGNR